MPIHRQTNPITFFFYLWSQYNSPFLRRNGGSVDSLAEFADEFRRAVASDNAKDSLARGILTAIPSQLP